MDPVRIGIRREEAKRLLKNLVEFVQEGDQASHELWNLITALRGPDSGDDNLKERTTARLRGAIGFNNHPYFMTSDAEPTTLERGELGSESHFRYHYNNALRTLKSWGLL